VFPAWAIDCAEIYPVTDLMPAQIRFPDPGLVDDTSYS
jgi:hypothetical protein